MASAIPASSTAEEPEPVQLGLLRTSPAPEECQRRQQNNLCLYCGESGHYVRNCPAKHRKCLTILPVNLPPVSSSSTHVALPISFQLPGRTIPVSAIIDSGACSCFVDLTFATQHQIPLQAKAQGRSVYLADQYGFSIRSETVTQETIPLPVLTSPSGHKELLCLDAISFPLFPVILGIPWLQASNPSIDWVTDKVDFQSC